MTQRRGRSKRISRKTRDVLEILDHVTGKDPELCRLIDRETLNARIAMMLYEVRTKAGLTQSDLARLVGTKQSVIARLEDADYEGHSLSMLQRIAAALRARIEIRIVPLEKGRPAA